MSNNINVINRVQLSVHVLDAVTTSGRVQVNGSAILLHNTGDEDVMIDNYKTLQVGRSLSIRTGDDANVLYWDMKIIFAGGGINPRLEVMEIRVDEEGYGNYRYK